MNARIEHLVTVGNVTPGGIPNHDNNVWLIGDDQEVIVIDPAHDAAAVWELVAGRRLVATILTHGHWDHVRAASDFAALSGASPWLAPADEFLWRAEHPDSVFQPLPDRTRFEVAGVTVEARHTPGHTPGSTSLWVPELNAVFSGDTLFDGGPGATRWEYSSFETIISSITTQLMALPDEVIVHTGHGTDTTIGAERARLNEYIARGW